MSEERIAGRIAIRLTSGYCALPAAGDTYKNCDNGCLYCYETHTPNQHLRRDFGKNQVVAVDYRSLFNSIYEDPCVREMVVRRGAAVRIGNLSDPFPPCELTLRNTERFISLCAKAGIDLQFTTKRPDNVDSAHVDVLKMLRKAMVRVSFSTLDDEVARILEPRTPPPSTRLREIRRLADQGVEVGARIEPYIHTHQYDFSLLAQAGVSNVTVCLLRWSALWRGYTSPFLWMGITGRNPPEGDVQDKKSAARIWVEQQERAYFASLRNEDEPYLIDDMHYIRTNVFKLRQLWTEVRSRIHASGLRFAICNFGCGIHSIDLNDNPCGCLTEGWRYDGGALVPAWHKNRWADYIVPAVYQYNHDLALERFAVANSYLNRPIALDSISADRVVVDAVDDSAYIQPNARGKRYTRKGGEE